ncbi:unnamed protein product [Parajaminaea phylloscopi]
MQGLRRGLGLSLQAMAHLGVDVDRLIAKLVAAGRVHSAVAQENPAPVVTESLLTTLIDLKKFVGLVEGLEQALRGATSPLLRDIHALTAAAQLAQIKDALDTALNDDLAATEVSRGGRVNKQNMRVYAVKAGANPLLDVARATYNENVEDIIKLCQDTATRYELPVTLRYAEPTGFTFELKMDQVTQLRGASIELPGEFVNVVRSKNRRVLSMSSMGLKKLNRRLRDSLNEVLMLVHASVVRICRDVLMLISALYKVSEAVALVDMVHCFAEIASESPCVRPSFGDTLAVRAGRHPILDSLQQGGVVPNDILSDTHSTFFVLTGINMSGKTTYLKQIALLTVMAYIGCYVPARYASFKPISAIMTRLCIDDDLERSL